MAITLLDLGTTANDGTGDDIRAGGTIINNAITTLDERTAGLNSASGAPVDAIDIDASGNVAFSASSVFGTGHVYIDELNGELYGLHIDIDDMGDEAQSYGHYIHCLIADFNPSVNAFHYGQRVVLDSTAAVTPTDSNGDRHYTYASYLQIEAAADYQMVGQYITVDVNGSDVTQSGTARGGYFLTRSYWDDPTGSGPTLIGLDSTIVAAHTAGASNSRGVQAEIQQDGAGGTLTTAYVFKADIDHNAGNMTTAAQFYGSTSGVPTVSWGLYSTGAGKHYSDANVASGVAFDLTGTSASFAGDILSVESATTAGTGFDLIVASASAGANPVFRVRGDGEVTADGAFTGGGADYAEMFEWADGNPGDQKRRGVPVVLAASNKIRPATNLDNPASIIGVTSSDPVVLGDAAALRWDKAFLRDEDGRTVNEPYTITEWIEVTETIEEEMVQTGKMISTKVPVMRADGKQATDESGAPMFKTTTHPEEIVKQKTRKKRRKMSAATDEIPAGTVLPASTTVRTHDDKGRPLMRYMVNPTWDPKRAYTPRIERKEWAAVGLMGKLRVAIGSPTGDRWLNMGPVNAKYDLWLVR